MSNEMKTIKDRRCAHVLLILLVVFREDNAMLSWLMEHLDEAIRSGSFSTNSDHDAELLVGICRLSGTPGALDEKIITVLLLWYLVSR